MNAKSIEQMIGEAREVMQYLIEINSPLRPVQERLINRLKAQMGAQTPKAPKASEAPEAVPPILTRPVNWAQTALARLTGPHGIR